MRRGQIIALELLVHQLLKRCKKIKKILHNASRAKVEDCKNRQRGSERGRKKKKAVIKADIMGRLENNTLMAVIRLNQHLLKYQLKIIAAKKKKGAGSVAVLRENFVSTACTNSCCRFRLSRGVTHGRL